MDDRADSALRAETAIARMIARMPAPFMICVMLSHCLAAAHRPLAPQESTVVPIGSVQVQGNALVDATGRPILLRGAEVEDPGTELANTGSFSSAQHFGGLSATTLSTIRQRWNMNAIRLPVSVLDYNRSAGYRRIVSTVVRRANELELLVLLAARQPEADPPAEQVVRFWRDCASSFKDTPRIIFDISSEPIGRLADARARVAAAQDWVNAIRSAGAAQTILAPLPGESAPGGPPADSLLGDPNIIFGVSAPLTSLQTDEDRLARFGSLPDRVPVLASIGDVDLNDRKACLSIPPDPSWIEDLVENNLSYFDLRHISWTVSSFRPGKLISDYRYFDATTFENGWNCNRPGSPLAGIGMGVQFHLWGTKIRGLLTVNGQTGNFVLARGGLAIGYGPILANAELGDGRRPLPTTLGGVSVRVTDSRGVARMAGILHVLAGWGQINFVIPPGAATGTAEIAIVRSDGTVAAGPAMIADIAPGLSAKGGNGRGPVIGEVIQRFVDGRIKSFNAGSCDQSHCWTNPISLSPRVSSKLRLVGSGFRYARSISHIHVKVGGMSVPVLAFSPGPDPGLDQLTIRLPVKLRNLGESDLSVSVDGRLSNVVLINTQTDNLSGSGGATIRR